MNKIKSYRKSKTIIICPYKIPNPTLNVDKPYEEKALKYLLS